MASAQPLLSLMFGIWPVFIPIHVSYFLHYILDTTLAPFLGVNPLLSKHFAISVTRQSWEAVKLNIYRIICLVGLQTNHSSITYYLVKKRNSYCKENWHLKLKNEKHKNTHWWRSLYFYSIPSASSPPTRRGGNLRVTFPHGSKC